MYKKPKVISFKLEGEALARLSNQASSFGMSPGLYARRLLTEVLLHQGSNQQVIEEIKDLKKTVISTVREVLYVALLPTDDASSDEQ